MLPLQQAFEVKHAILEYLKATFDFKDKKVHKSFYDFVTHPQDGIFKGPYISLKLPFVTAGKDLPVPLEIKPDFPPYDHQYLSFQRLSTRDGNLPKPTLVTTGTSSGKTESFLYPILDYCFENIHRQGIKVIILYPMNALASDQAKRMAEIIWKDERLKGKITAGLFIGEGKDKKKFPSDMGSDHVIENRNSIVDSPPDILLTNFKMLDYGLMQAQYYNLWTFNLQEPDMLRFLVLDELHTYDGAQGTDVANLIRRLKLKLDIPAGILCPVGTSATIGSGPEAKADLVKYASRVFGETIDETAIISENRQSLEQFIPIPDDELEKFVPRSTGLAISKIGPNESYEAYIKRQKQLWQLHVDTSKYQLGEELKKLQIVKDLLSLTQKGIISLEHLISDLAEMNTYFKGLPEWDSASQHNPREETIHSLLALISEAKSDSKERFPFLFLQIQIWIREFSGLLREMQENPVFSWKDKVGAKNDAKGLPPYFCRECGASGWLGIKHDNRNQFETEPKDVYDYYFKNHKNVYFINTPNHKGIEEYQPSDSIHKFVHKTDLTIHDLSSQNNVEIMAYRIVNDKGKCRHVCPECNTENSISIIGTRVPTLSSIVVSHVLASDLDFRSEKYRKVLAFTNSVQDAAHQAGFVEARNYRFTFRASLQKVINQLDGTVSITQLQKEFLQYWKEHSATDDDQEKIEAFVYRFFPADYKGKVNLARDYRDLGGKFTNAFLREFDLRMNWEVVSEFSYNALIGRTLEKTGTSAVFFDPEKTESIFDQMKEWLEANNLQAIQKETFQPFLVGILNRMRTRGGVDHPFLEKFRSDGLRLWDLNWMKDPRHFLNKMFDTKSRFPRLVTTNPHHLGLLDSTYTLNNNWFRNYFLKSFKTAAGYAPIINDFYKRLFQILGEAGILNEKGVAATKNYAISPDSLLVSNLVRMMECNTCGNKLSLSGKESFYSRIFCLDYNCPGQYEREVEPDSNYYKMVYNRSLSPRIYASEHTGLLERKDREEKERDFKNRPKFNSLNAMVATSTLEMGIDIGTLNTAINNSMPPATSNFLQRVGRAGRSTGSALISNFALSKAHDLFYFEEPLEMMEGDVSTPGCFLEAKDILFRHFLAFCLDSWASSNPKDHVIPGRVLTLRLSVTNLSESGFIANRINSFIKANEASLLNRFKNQYKRELPDNEVFERLDRSLREDQFYRQLPGVFEKLKSEFLDLEEKRKEIVSYIKEKKLPENDPERIELEAEKRALQGLKRLIDKRAVLEHLTNSGLLPNYAFPETGVKLNAWVKSFPAKESEEKHPKDLQFEIVRGAVQAIREFAPENTFYGQGFKFEISGLNTFDWKDPSVLLEKRFCSNCDHLEENALANETICPKCGDPSWNADSNKHTFVKLSAVKSVNSRDKASLDDSKDDRDKEIFKLSRHLKFEANSSWGAWGMKEIPFGIEFVKSVSCTEVNLGLSSVNNVNNLQINQISEVPRHGFITCRYCGKSTSNPHTGDLKFHYGYCKHKEHTYSGQKDEVFAEVFLTREIQTETIKILLPVQEIESHSTVEMFKAGLKKGLRLFYKGNPEHIGIWDYQEYNKKNGRFDKYVILYDTIPGGTGYLERLFDPTKFTEVLRLSYLAIKDCSCQHQGNDGCYRCIFSYQNQYVQGELSRTKAERLFRKIIDKSDAWENFLSGLGSLSGTGQIEESELEDRFIRSLRNIAKKKELEGWKFEDSREGGIINYYFTISKKDRRFTYLIQPQVELGSGSGVTYNTRTDFLISLSLLEIAGQAVSDLSMYEQVKKTAIYLDGYGYHASSDNMRFFNDLKKRNGIVESGSILSWTLSWSDLELFDKEETDSLILDKTRFKTSIGSFQKAPLWKYKSEFFEAKTSMDRLLWFLTNPLDDDYRKKKLGLFFAVQQNTFGRPTLDPDDILSLLTKPEQISPERKASNLSSGLFYMISECSCSFDFASFRIAVQMKDLTIKTGLLINEGIEVIDKAEWESFWRVYNLVQEFIIQPKVEVTEPSLSSTDYSFLAYFDQDLLEIVKELDFRKIPFEKEGSFFLDEEGFPSAEAALGFKARKIFLKPVSEQDREVFLNAGYKEVQVEEFKIEMVL